VTITFPTMKVSPLAVSHHCDSLMIMLGGISAPRRNHVKLNRAIIGPTAEKTRGFIPSPSIDVGPQSANERK
jgi:hypothetical protein